MYCVCYTGGGDPEEYKLKKWNGTDAWTKVSQSIWMNNLVECNGKLYGCGYATGILFEWNGTDTWVAKTSDIGFARWMPISAHGGIIYGFRQNSTPTGMYCWIGSGEWTHIADCTDTINSEDAMYSFGTSLFVSFGITTNAGDAKLYKWDGSGGFDFITYFLDSIGDKEHSIYGMIDLNGVLYVLSSLYLQRVSTGSVVTKNRIRMASYRKTV
jgi:hypothetical protein